MATTTTNLGLTLPANNENVSRQIINSNNSIIDGIVAKSVYVGWGTSAEAEGFHIGTIQTNSRLPFNVFFGSTNEIHVRWVSTTGSALYKNATDTITFGQDSTTGNDFTITRSGDKLTISCQSSNRILIVYR